MAEYDNKVALGSSITQLVTLIKNALTGKQNTLTAGSGIDITNDVISSTGGGSSLPTDPSTDGAYKLVNTVETDSGEQTATLSWEEDSGYTAGDGIKIDNDKISRSFDISNILLLLFMSVYDGDAVPRNTINNLLISYSATSNEEAIAALKKHHFCFLKDTTLNTLYNILPAVDPNYVEPSDHYIHIGTITGTNMAFSSTRTSTLGNMGAIAIFYFPEKAASSATSLNPRWLYVSFNSLAHCLQYSRVSISDFTAVTIKGAIQELATTRIADSLSSTADTPSTNNTIIWQYE